MLGQGLHDSKQSTGSYVLRTRQKETNGYGMNARERVEGGLGEGPPFYRTYAATFFCQLRNIPDLLELALLNLSRLQGSTLEFRYLHSFDDSHPKSGCSSLCAFARMTKGPRLGLEPLGAMDG